MAFIIILIINFLALGIGGYFTGPGVASTWYNSLQKAPWTPPGWVFGAAWTFIMFTFSWYLSLLWKDEKNHITLLILIPLHWLINVSWNVLFFYFQNSLWGLVSITTLLILLIAFIFIFKNNPLNWFLTPYITWILIATSLNLYISLKN